MVYLLILFHTALHAVIREVPLLEKANIWIVARILCTPCSCWVWTPHGWHRHCGWICMAGTESRITACCTLACAPNFYCCQGFFFFLRHVRVNNYSNLLYLYTTLTWMCVHVCKFTKKCQFSQNYQCLDDCKWYPFTKNTTQKMARRVLQLIGVCRLP